jgi:hypothetical protein
MSMTYGKHTAPAVVKLKYQLCAAPSSQFFHIKTNVFAND